MVMQNIKLYLVVKDTLGDYGGESKRSIVLNKASSSQAFSSKSCALSALKEMIEDTEEEYEILDDEKYSGLAYSLWDGHEIFYIHEIYLDNSL